MARVKLSMHFTLILILGVAALLPFGIAQSRGTRRATIYAALLGWAVAALVAGAIIYFADTQEPLGYQDIIGRTSGFLFWSFFIAPVASLIGLGRARRRKAD